MSSSSASSSTIFTLVLVLVTYTALGSRVDSTGDGRGNATHPSKLLFLDDQVLSASGLHGGAEIQLQTPEKIGRVIIPEYEWEMWELGGYDAWLQLPNGTMYFYYTCIANCSGTSDAECIQRVCLAVSEDGRHFRKPFVHQQTYKGSKANNIIWPPDGSGASYGGSAFLDTNPTAPLSERYKMLLTWGGEFDGLHHPSGEYALSSSDGITWKPMSATPAHVGSDSQQTGWWDETLGKYVIYVRNDGYDESESGGARYIARCVTSDLTNWYEDAPPPKPGCTPTEANPCRMCHSVFGPNEVDPTQLYTSGATPLALGDGGSAITLFFPTAYRIFEETSREAVCACGNNHCGSEAGNCGVVDVRFAFSRERGKAGSVYYVPTATGRDAVIPLGRNTCFNSACGWCHADGDRTLERTAWDTSQIYSIPGLYTPAATLGGEGGGVLVYYNGSPWAHGQTFGVDGVGTTWGSNHGIGAVRYRKDGFVAVTAPSAFQVTEPAGWPGFTTQVISVPTNCPPMPTSKRTLNCSYELPNSICAGAQPELLPCNATIDCTNADKGTCENEHPYCATSVPTWCKPPLTPLQIAQCNRTNFCVANAVWWCVGHIPAQPVVHVSLRANFATSGPGDVRAGVLVNGRPIDGFSIDSADPGFGDFVDKTLTWNEGDAAVPLPVGTKELAVQVAMRGAKLFSLELVCTADTNNS